MLYLPIIKIACLLRTRQRGWVDNYKDFKTCSFRRWGSCTWCWCRRPLPRASPEPPGSPESGRTSSCSFAVRSRFYPRYWLNYMKFTSFILEHIKHWQDLPVVGDQCFSDHLARQHQLLDFLQRNAHHFMVLRRQGFYIIAKSLFIGIINWGNTGSSLFGFLSIN